MSTQTKTPAELAEEFLKKYATVVGTNKAIEDKNSEFLLKYATVVGTPEAVETYAPTETTEPTDPEETEIIDVGGDPIEEGEEN